MGENELSYSITAAIVYVVSSVFFFFLVLFLFVVGLSPMTPCFRLVRKLDGVGPVDNRPSTDQLHRFVLFLFFVLRIKKKM